MKRIKSTFLFYTALLCFFSSVGQMKSIKTFRDGERVPNFTMQVHRGATTETVHLYELKKKLVIFDIWGTNCTSCIKAMPHMLELQQKFKDEVQIILVTRNRKEEVDSLWNKLKGHIPLSIVNAYRQLPSIVNDSIISYCFPVTGYPTHVWIDSTHTLRAVAHSTTTTPDNLSAFLQGQQVRIDEIGLKNIDFNNPLSWLNGDTGFLSSLKYYSFILSRINHAGHNDRSFFTQVDPASGKIIGISCLNTPLTDLYKLAYFKYSSPNIQVADYKVLLEVENESRFRWEMDNSKFNGWADTNLFCFAIKVPPEEADSIYVVMRSLLDSYFHYKSRLAIGRVRCLAMKRISKEDKLKTTRRETVYEMSVSSKGSFLVFKNQPIDNLFSTLQSYIWSRNSFIPVFNETGYTNNIDLMLPWSEDFQQISLQDVKRSLNKYGLDLVEEYKDLPMLVISDAK